MPDNHSRLVTLLLPGKLPAKHSLQRLQHLVIVTDVQDQQSALRCKLRGITHKDL